MGWEEEGAWDHPRPLLCAVGMVKKRHTCTVHSQACELPQAAGWTVYSTGFGSPSTSLPSKLHLLPCETKHKPQRGSQPLAYLSMETGNGPRISPQEPNVKQDRSGSSKSKEKEHSKTSFSRSPDVGNSREPQTAPLTTQGLTKSGLRSCSSELISLAGLCPCRGFENPQVRLRRQRARWLLNAFPSLGFVLSAIWMSEHVGTAELSRGPSGAHLPGG